MLPFGIAVPLASGQKAYDCANTECNAEDLIGMVADCLVGEADSIERFVPNLLIGFFAAFHGSTETLADFVYFFPGYGGGLCHYALGVIGKRAHVIADSLFLLFHKLVLLIDDGLIGDFPAAKSSLSRRMVPWLSSTKSRRGQFRCLVCSLTHVVLARQPGGADVLRASLFKDVPGSGDVANIIGVNREENVAFLDFNFVLRGFGLRQAQRDQTAGNSAESGIENNPAQNCHDRSGGNERPDTRNGERANFGDPAQYVAHTWRGVSTWSLNVLFMGGIPNVIRIWEQHGDVLVGEALGFQVINNSMSLAA
jgi:hypothetical protein